MKKLSLGSAFCAILLSTSGFAGDWSGRNFDVMPRHAGITKEYCEAHIPMSYKIDMKILKNGITNSNNGVMAKDIKESETAMGGVFIVKGTATVWTKNSDGKEWKDTVNFAGFRLEKEEGSEHGVWYTKDCKGFYEIVP